MVKLMGNRIHETNGIPKIEKPVEEKEYHPQLLWPNFRYIDGEVYEEDEMIFIGDSESMKNQKNAFSKIQREEKYSPGSNTFWNCFRVSTDILFVDNFFDENAYRRMLRELKEVFKARDKFKKSIQIYCSDKYTEVCNLHSESVKGNGEMFAFFSVKINRLEMWNSTHDRFAIMDQEIWHCGAAVGGMHGSLSALSRGWKDENDCLKKYFCGKESS